VILPKLYDEKNLEEVKKYLGFSLKYFLLIMIPACAGLSVVARPLLRLLSTAEISDNSYFVVPFVAMSMLFYGALYFFSQILVLAKKTNLIAALWAISAFCNLILNIFLIPLFGIVGAAAVTLISYFLTFCLMVYFSSRQFTFNVDGISISKSLFSSAIMVFSIILFLNAGFSNVFFLIPFGILVYFVCMIIVGAVGKKEILFLKDLYHEVAFSSK